MHSAGADFPRMTASEIAAESRTEGTSSGDRQARSAGTSDRSFR